MAGYQMTVRSVGNTDFETVLVDTWKRDYERIEIEENRIHYIPVSERAERLLQKATKLSIYRLFPVSILPQGLAFRTNRNHLDEQLAEEQLLWLKDWLNYFETEGEL